ncbi:MAG: adenylate/guanylate cyclase domain-containing protein [Anaerolineae bacterium]|nr:adenylate/guanylate cyclase domain-containing protein [Anaerolineae bacterium]
MPFDFALLPSQAIFPSGVALAYIALCLYLLSWRKPDTIIDRLFVTYLVLTALWDVSLVVAVNDVPALYPGIGWVRVSTYGLIFLGVVYWMFARAFLYLPWRQNWALILAGTGLVLGLAVDLKLLSISAGALAWSNGWLNESNLGFVLCVIWWAGFMALTIFQTLAQQWQTRNPAHRNRIQYLLLATVMLTLGYGLYLTLRDPFWTAGLVITGLGGALTTYIVVAEDLLDLGTGLRRLIRSTIVVLAVVSAYVVGVYLVQILLGRFLVTYLGGLMDETLLIATVTVFFLAIFYIPIRSMSRSVANRFLFGQNYDYETVIKNYSQVISNRLYLRELAGTATTHIEQALGLQRSTLFMLEAVSNDYLTLQALSAREMNGSGVKSIILERDKPVAQRLYEEMLPLAQYTIDISTHYKSVSDDERNALKSLHYEWYIPVHKEDQLIGVLAVGTKKSGRPYTNRDISLLNTMADQTALALENATLFDRVQRNLEDMTRMKNLMDGVFDSMDNGVITTDVSGNITFYNRAAEKILAVPLAGAVGSPYTEVMPSLANTIFSNLVKNVLEREESYNDYEIISDLPDRGRAHLNISLTALKDARNRTRGVTIVLDDLTETKRLQAVQSMFRRYVSPAVVDRLPHNPKDLALGGHRQETSILFADIRGFTSFSEHLLPEVLVDVLNQYLSMAASSILMYEGTLDKFMGDAVMGIFNAPLPQEDHVLRAVRAAAAMQRSIADYHRNTGEEQGLQFGVGLHVGEVVVGNVGMSDRMDYTAIGDAVNLAKRIQENTPGGKVLMSEAVYEVVAQDVDAVFFQEMQVRGRQQPINVYELLKVHYL